MTDEDLGELIAAYERGEFKPVKRQQAAKQTAVEAARRYLRRDARINIRLSTADLEMLKRRAAEEFPDQAIHLSAQSSVCQALPSPLSTWQFSSSNQSAVMPRSTSSKSL